MVVILAAAAFLLAAAWVTWRWQRSADVSCGTEPRVAGTTSHDAWSQCRASQQADRAVPVALAVFIVTAGGVAVGCAVRSTTHRVRGELS